MVKSVENKKGFWVGRYETSNARYSSYNNTNQVKVVKGAVNGESKISDIHWTCFYLQQKNYSNLVPMSNTKSSMIWGSQWDQIMIWMRNVENKSQNSYYILNSLQMGNHKQNDEYPDTSNPAPTGCYDVKNIYDLAGNLHEWTCEVKYTSRSYRRRFF